MSEEKKNWFDTGYGGAERESERRELGYGPKRFWLKPKGRIELVFVDDSPFAFPEHQWKLEGQKQPEFGTCILGVHNECAGCSGKGVQKAEYTGHLTAIDCTGYMDKNGTEHKFELVEFCPKNKVMLKLKNKKERTGSLIAQLFSVFRTDEQSPNTGDDFDLVREVQMPGLYARATYHGKSLKDMIAVANGSGAEAAKVRKYLAHHFDIPAEGAIPEVIPVFNYVNLHAPMAPADFARAIIGAQAYTGGNFGPGPGKTAPATGKADEDVPF